MYVGCDDSNVYALDAGTGLKLWNFTTGHEVDSSPTVCMLDAMTTTTFGFNDGNVHGTTFSPKFWNYNAGHVVDSSPTTQGLEQGPVMDKRYPRVLLGWNYVQ